DPGPADGRSGGARQEGQQGQEEVEAGRRVMSVSWYDVLGVAPDATTDEIRAAWREATADLEPTDRRFDLYNQAAKVLLDADSRAAYDADGSDAGKPGDEPLAPDVANDANDADDADDADEFDTADDA